MSILFKKPKHFYTRLPLSLGVVGFITLSPFIIGFVGAWFTELITNTPCNEGNCFWGVIPWFFMITMPIGGVLMFILCMILIIDIIKILKRYYDKKV